MVSQLKRTVVTCSQSAICTSSPPSTDETSHVMAPRIFAVTRHAESFANLAAKAIPQPDHSGLSVLGGTLGPMSGAAHDATKLAAFQSGEQRLVYARYRDLPSAVPYYLPEGGASTTGARAWVKEHLECLMPACVDRRLVVVNRAASGRRDGFSHLGGAGGHSPESLFSPARQGRHPGVGEESLSARDRPN